MQADVAHESADAVEHLLALDGVGLDDRPLVGVELAGLVDDLLGDRDLADVVQEGAELEVAALLGARAELVGDCQSEADDALAVLAGVAVVGLDDVPSTRAVPR